MHPIFQVNIHVALNDAADYVATVSVYDEIYTDHEVFRGMDDLADATYRYCRMLGTHPETQAHDMVSFKLAIHVDDDEDGVCARYLSRQITRRINRDNWRGKPRLTLVK